MKISDPLGKVYQHTMFSRNGTPVVVQQGQGQQSGASPTRRPAAGTTDHYSIKPFQGYQRQNSFSKVLPISRWRALKSLQIFVFTTLLHWILLRRLSFNNHFLRSIFFHESYLDLQPLHEEPRIWGLFKNGIIIKFIPLSLWNFEHRALQFFLQFTYLWQINSFYWKSSFWLEY